MSSGECDVVSLYVLCCSVNGSVCFVCCVFVNCLVKQFAICLLLKCGWRCSIIYWIDHAWSSKACVCCACGSSERLNAPSICFVSGFVCRKLSPHLGV